MKVFNGISPSDGEKTVFDAVVAILERAQEQRLFSSKWSLAELQLDDDDFEWLCNWTVNLSGITVYLWLEVEPWRGICIGTREGSRSAALGSLLLLFVAENARRNASEGILWATFPQEQFSKSTLRLLYANGQPTRSFKDAVEAAARWLNLRHVFGIEGLQNWFDTVYLQFGFTYRGFIRRLPEWLIGQGGTQAIQHLLAGQIRSETFCTLWDALRNFRRSNVKLEQLKTILARNPWVLPEWIDELATQATARIELGDGREIRTSGIEDAFEPFLDEPILRWNTPQAPQFVCRISNIAKFDLSEPIYYITVGEQICAQLCRNVDGVYLFHPSEEIVLPIITPLLVATLISSADQIVSSLTLTLWDDNDEINVFRASTGKRIDAWQDMMRSEVTYFIITVQDLVLSPESSHWYRLDAQGTKLSIIGQGWSPSLNVQLEKQIFWQPNSKYGSKGEEPRWVRSVDVSLFNTPNVVSFGDPVQVKIHYPEGTSISFIRLNAKAMSFIVVDAQHVITESIAVNPGMLFHGSHLAELCFTLGIRKNTTITRVSRALNLAVVGAGMLSMQGWTVLQPDIAMTVEQAKTLPIQIFRSNIKQWALLEGDIWVGRPHYTPRPIGSLAGLGASIRLRKGPYNAVEKDVPLVREVIDHGIINDISNNSSPSSTNLSIHLTHPLELGEEHRVVVWNEDGTLCMWSQEDTVFEVDNASWYLQLPSSLSHPLIAAVAYGGVRLGTWWLSTWCDVLHRNNAQHPREVAALLRWFQLPILSDRWFSHIRQFSRDYGGSILPVWLSDDSSLMGLHWSVADDHWLSAVRIVFKSWRPNDMDARKVVSQLGGTSEVPEELLMRTAWRLLRVDPFLMGKVVRLFIRNVCLPRLGLTSTRKFMHTLIAAFAESLNDNDDDLLQKKALLLEKVSDTMGYIDTNFIKRGLIEPALRSFRGGSLNMLEENNIELALNIEPFRRLLGIQILEVIERVIISGR